MKSKKIVIGLMIVNIILLFYGIMCKNGNIILEKQIIKEMTQSELESSLDSTITELNENQQKYATEVDANKAKIAEAITEMGVETAESADADTMASNIRNIKSGVEPLKRSYTITITGATNTTSDYNYKTYTTDTLETIEGYVPYAPYIYSINSYNGGTTIGSNVLEVNAKSATLTSDKTKASVSVKVRGTVNSTTTTTIVLHVLYLPE